MVGILIQLALSWLVLWFYDRSSLTVLGITPTRERLRHLMLFFAVTALFSASVFGLRMWIGHQRWEPNPAWTWTLIAFGVWFNVKSVMYEELIFRGALFYMLIQRFGTRWAIAVSASTFGAYHWFSQGSLGDIPSMAITFIVTGSMGFVLAYAFVKTRSLFVPFAIHFGWNSIQQVIFSNGPIGNQWLIPAAPESEVTVSYPAFLFMLLFPIVGVLVVNTWLIRRIKVAST